MFFFKSGFEDLTWTSRIKRSIDLTNEDSLEITSSFLYDILCFSLFRLKGELKRVCLFKGIMKKGRRESTRTEELENGFIDPLSMLDVSHDNGSSVSIKEEPENWVLNPLHPGPGAVFKKWTLILLMKFLLISWTKNKIS